MLITLLLLSNIRLLLYKITMNYLLSLFFCVIYSFILDHFLSSFLSFFFFLLFYFVLVFNDAYSEYTQRCKNTTVKDVKGFSKSFYLKTIIDQLELLKKTIVIQ